MKIPLKSRFTGCMLGLAIGDALGGKFEGQMATYIRSRFPTLADLMGYDTPSLWYTDDTQMMIGVAECLITHREIVEASLCKAFVENYNPSRGYGRGARAVIWGKMPFQCNCCLNWRIPPKENSIFNSYRKNCIMCICTHNEIL